MKKENTGQGEAGVWQTLWAGGKEDREKRIRTLCLVILIMLFVLNSVRLLNGRQKSLRDFDTVSLLGNDIYLLEHPERGRNGRYKIQLFLKDSDEAESFMLSFIECNPFELYVDGREIYRYGNENGYQRMINVSLGDLLKRKEAVTLELAMEELAPGDYIYFGPESKLFRLFVLTMVLQTFEMGMLTAMLIYAVSLYFRKRSERYLPPFFIYVGILLIWSLCQLEFAPLVFYIQFFNYLRGFFHLLTILECTESALIFTGTMTRRLKQVLNWRVSLLVSLVFALIELVSLDTLPGLFISAFPYAIGGAASVYLSLASGEERRGVTLAFAATHALRFLAYLSGFNGFVREVHLNCFRTVPGFDLLFIMGSMILINRIFAGKFAETDQLVIRLEESNRLLEETNQRLDQKVEERTALLRENEKKKRQLMLNVFHDLRSPIFIVRGYTEMIPAETEEAKRNLQVMKEKLSFLSHLTEDLFLLSKLEENKIIFCEDPVDLTGLLTDLAESCQMEAREKSITLRAELEPACTTIGDAFRLEQAFQNIITNAVKYTPEGGHVTVRLRHDGEYLQAEVEDDGIGIPKEDLERIFQLYYVRDRSSKTASTGLGLSITQEIIRHHAGTIRAESEEGSGATFIVRLPVTGPEMGVEDYL